MRRTLSLTCSLVFIALLPVLALAQGNSNSSAKATAPKDDAGIEKCISDKLAASASLKTQGISARLVTALPLCPHLLAMLVAASFATCMLRDSGKVATHG